MKIAAIVCNIILIGFTCLVTLTDGPPQGTDYVVFGLLLILIPVLNVVLISRSGKGAGLRSQGEKEIAAEGQKEIQENSATGPVMKIIAVVSNVVLLGFVCWAILDQYPHPKEGGVLEFELLAILTPILSAAAVIRSGAGRRRPSHHLRGSASEEQRGIDAPAGKQDA